MYKSIGDIPITNDLLSAVRQAHRKYKERIEAEKTEAIILHRKKQEAAKQQQMDREALEKHQKKKRSLNNQESEVKQSETELKADMDKATLIFDEANARLSQAIKKKDFKEMNIAQGLLDVAKSNLDKISTAMSKCIDERNEIGKKRMRMIDSFLSKANQDKN